MPICTISEITYPTNALINTNVEINIRILNFADAGKCFITILDETSGDFNTTETKTLGHLESWTHNFSFNLNESKHIQISTGDADLDPWLTTDINHIDIIADEPEKPNIDILFIAPAAEQNYDNAMRLNYAIRNTGASGVAKTFIKDITNDGLEYSNIHPIAAGVRWDYFQVITEPPTQAVIRMITGYWESPNFYETDISFITVYPGLTFTLTIITNPPNCNVTIESPTHPPETIISDEDGNAIFSNVTAGVYTLTVSKSGLTTKEQSILVESDIALYVDIGDAPDFWSDPIGWIQYFVITTLENFLGWISGALKSLLQQTFDFFNGFYITLEGFFSDLSTNIMNYVNPFIEGFISWIDEGFSNISDWWNQKVNDIGIWWNDAIENLSNWVDSGYDNLSQWWDDKSAAWGTFWNDTITGMQTWIDDFAANVDSWYKANLEPTINAINQSTTDFASWVLDFGTNVDEWWSGVSEDIGIWWSDTLEDLGKGWEDFTTQVGAAWNATLDALNVVMQVQFEIYNVIMETYVEGFVMAIFGEDSWIGGIFKGISDFLTGLMGIFDKSYEQEPEIKKSIEDQKIINERVREIIEEL